MKDSNVAISNGRFKTINGNIVSITYSQVGHYPGSEGRCIFNQIISEGPEFVLIEESPFEHSELRPDKQRTKQQFQMSGIHTDAEWALKAASQINARVVYIDLSRKDFLLNIYKSFRNLSKQFGIKSVIAHAYLNILHHRIARKRPFDKANMSRAVAIYLKDAPNVVKQALQRQDAQELYMEWCRFWDLTEEEILRFGPEYLSWMLIRLPSRTAREFHLFQTVETYASRGRTSVVTGRNHVENWILNKWITKL